MNDSGVYLSFSGTEVFFFHFGVCLVTSFGLMFGHQILRLSFAHDMFRQFGIHQPLLYSEPGTVFCQLLKY